MKWEYYWAGCGELRARGEEGWEAIAVAFTPSTETTDSCAEVLMKRAALPDPDAVTVRVSARYGIFLATGPNSSGWLKDANGYVMSSDSRIVMEAQASELDSSWCAEVRLMP